MQHEPASDSPPQRNYRRTLGDRLGPRAGHMYQIAGWTGFGAIMAIPVTLYYGPSNWPAALTVPLGFFLAWAMLFALALFLAAPAEKVARFYLAPTGASTPYEEQFSREEALVMQRRVPDALALYELRIRSQPNAIAPRIRAAELYSAQGGDPRRAAELFREAQRIPGLTSGQDLYVGNRLADLYLGPLGTPARALVELRRLLDRYPDSRVAPQLKAAIAKLKAEHVPDERSG